MDFAWSFAALYGQYIRFFLCVGDESLMCDSPEVQVIDCEFRSNGMVFFNVLQLLILRYRFTNSFSPVSS